MAKKIPPQMLEHVIKNNPRTEYNWEKYADGDWWEFRRGEDYQVQTQSARSSATNWAKSNGYDVETATLKEQDGFAFRFKG